MANKRHKPEEIVQRRRQVDVLVGQAMARVDAIREVRLTEQTYYQWRKQYGDMGTDQLRELKRLQKENDRLRRFCPKGRLLDRSYYRRALRCRRRRFSPSRSWHKLAATIDFDVEAAVGHGANAIDQISERTWPD